jgi:hypothetical protein
VRSGLLDRRLLHARDVLHLPLYLFLVKYLRTLPYWVILRGRSDFKHLGLSEFSLEVGLVADDVLALARAQEVGAERGFEALRVEPDFIQSMRIHAVVSSLALARDLDLAVGLDVKLDARAHLGHIKDLIITGVRESSPLCKMVHVKAVRPTLLPKLARLNAVLIHYHLDLRVLLCGLDHRSLGYQGGVHAWRVEGTRRLDEGRLVGLHPCFNN